MESSDSVDAIRGLHQDLIALSESRLATIEKLCQDLEAHIDDFRKFLDKNPRSEAKRQEVLSGKIKIDDVEYNLNKEFQDEAIQLSDILELDQVEAAGLLLQGQAYAEILDRKPITCAIIRYHEGRSFLAECFRLVFKMSLDLDMEEEVRGVMQTLITMILGTSDRPSSNGSPLVQKCLNTMLQIEAELNRVAEEVQKIATLSQVPSPDAEEVMGLQQQNMTQQHESVGAILTHLVKGNYAKIENFNLLLEQMPKIDKWNLLAVHYVPALVAFSTHYGSTEGNVSFDEAKVLHKTIIDSRDSKPWPLRNFHAAMITWWLAEFNSWYLDPPTSTPVPAEDMEKDAEARTNALHQALRDGAFQCTLSICSQIKPSDWYDPAREGLIRSLLNDAPVLPFEPASINAYFQELLMESYEVFAEAFIANMPDTLRRFKIEGDDQRRRFLGAGQQNAQDGMAEYDRHLERFFVIVSYVYEGRPESSDVFWGDTDGYMYGFLQWFSRKVSTPLLSAFCEMFRAISVGEESAAAAHAFLLDEGPVNSSRIKKSASLSWAQMFEELDFYARKIRDNPSIQVSATAVNGKPKPVEVDEPETPIMLECYLRLISHMCAESSVVRQWILAHPTFQLVDTLFLLCNNTVPSRIRVCTYTCLRGLLKDKRTETSDSIWIALDQWVSNGFSAGSNIPRPAKLANASSWAEEITFEAITTDPEEADSFACLLQALLTPTSESDDLRDAVPFPEQLGSSYRMPGVEPYIDLALGKIFAKKVTHLDRSLKQHVLAAHCLHIVQTCLESFNENLIVIGNRSSFSVDSLIRASSLSNYAQMHPFARAIEWMFNEKVLSSLFLVAHQDISDVNSAQADSPLITCLLRAIKVMNLVMDLQSTYLDIVRPLIKTKSTSRRQAVANPSLVSFEDSITTNLRIIGDLGYYSGSGHEELALVSLELLKKFSMSRKLNVSQPNKIGARLMINRMVGAVQQHDDVDPIARSMSRAMDFDAQELSLGVSAPGFNIKFAILDFLEKTLAAHPEKPNMAHALLGFDCTGAFVKIQQNSLFANKISLYHAIQKLGLEYPDNVDGIMLYWALTIKQKATEIIRLLWSSRLTSDIILSEMRLTRVLFWQWMSQTSVDQDTQWELSSLRDPEFLYTDSSKALAAYLKSRRAMYAYSAVALRRAVSDDVTLLKAQITSTILGATVTEDLEGTNLSIFDLLDFMELEPRQIEEPDLSAALGMDFGIACDRSLDGTLLFDMKLIEQMLALKRSEMKQANALPDEAAVEKVNSDFREALAHFNGLNNRTLLYEARLSALTSWVDVITVLIQSSGLEPDDRTALSLQALQVICPKLELYASTSRPEALIFARLAQTLLSQLDFSSSTLEAGRTSDVPNDRLFQLFKISINAIPNPEASTPLRESLYNICIRYLAYTVSPEAPTAPSAPSSTTSASSHAVLTTQVVRAAGDTLIDTISDDAYSDESACRIAALLLLDALTQLHNTTGSKHILDALVRTNFLAVLTERIQTLPAELTRAPENTTPNGPGPAVVVPYLLSFYHATLTLLLTVAQTRAGATHVLNAGLFPCIRRSGLFATDPDIGLDGEEGGPEALGRYYGLLLHVLKVVAAVVVSRGVGNAGTVEMARGFLAEGRLLMVGVIKRDARITRAGSGGGEGEEEVRRVLRELVEVYLVLIRLTGFLEFEEDLDTQRIRKGVRQFS